MTPEREPGFLIHQRPYQERSVLLEILTLNFGRVDAVLRMTKGNEAMMKALLQPYAPLFFSFRFGRSELAVVTDVFPGERNPALAMPAIFCADYLNELLHYLYREREGSAELFAAYIGALERLREGSGVEDTLRDFELKLLSVLGYAQDFKNPAATAWEENSRYVFIAGRGFVKAGEAFTEGESITGHELNALAAGNDDHATGLMWRKRVNSAVIGALLNGRKLKSRELYRRYLQDIA